MRETTRIELHLDNTGKEGFYGNLLSTTGGTEEGCVKDMASTTT
jgi:hypothetical protein